MPLPYRTDSVRAIPEWRFFDLYDPSFEPSVEPVIDEAGDPVVGEDGRPKTLEKMGFVTVALRPLFDIEIDKVERSEAYRDFMARHFTGGFEIDTPRGKETVADPMPLIVEGKPTEVDEDHALLMHRTEAMQRPAIGQGPPVAPGGRAISFVDVKEMVAAAAGKADLFWKGLQASMVEVWTEGQQGKGFRQTGSVERPAA